MAETEYMCFIIHTGADTQSAEELQDLFNPGTRTCLDTR